MVRWFRVGVLTLLPFVLASCPPAGDSALLTVVLEANLVGANGHSVRVFVDDFVHTRGSAPYGDPSREVLVFQASDELEATSVNIASGQTVSIIAFDGAPSMFGETSSSNVSSLNGVEFVGFDGDDKIDKQAEFGATSFVMNGNRTVTVTFQEMGTILVRQEFFEGPGSGVFPGDLDVELSIPFYLGMPGEQVVFTPVSCCGGDTGIVLGGQLRSGSVLTLTPDPFGSPATGVFSSWDLDCSGNGPCVVMAEAGINKEVQANWEPEFP